MALYVTAHRGLLRSASLLRELPAVAARRRRHSTRPADKGALVTPQPAVICARLHAQTPTPAPQPTRSSDATGRCLWRCTRGPLMPSRETGVIRFCVATHRRSVVRQTFSLAWPMRARPWTACARASSTADTEPTIDVLINNAGRMLVTCWARARSCRARPTAAAAPTTPRRYGRRRSPRRSRAPPDRACDGRLGLDPGRSTRRVSARDAPARARRIRFDHRR